MCAGRQAGAQSWFAHRTMRWRGLGSRASAGIGSAGSEAPNCQCYSRPLAAPHHCRRKRTSWRARARTQEAGICPTRHVNVCLSGVCQTREVINDSPEARKRRNSVLLTAVACVAPTGEACRYRIRNLSASGACLANAGALREGENLELTIGAVENILSTVIWAADGLAGVRFEHEIDLEAAHTRRSTGAVGAPTAGWAAEIRNAYGRR